MRLAHLSDLHFGADVPELVAGLRADLRREQPDQLLVSGDLTMRARDQEFRAARELLDSFAVPWTAVPGNHDLPLDRLARLYGPLEAYRKWISPDPEPVVLRDGVLTVGLSSPRPYRWKDGSVSTPQAAAAAAAFEAPAKLKIVMLHHPVFRSPQRPAEQLVHGSAALSSIVADIILCGHDHVAAHTLLRPGLLGIMAGTVTSWRIRAGEPQSYNLLDFDGSHLTLRVRAWTGSAFEQRSAFSWTRTADGWAQ